MNNFKGMAGQFGDRLGWNQATPPKTKLGQVGDLCCTLPDGSAGLCFDTGTGECVPTWSGVRSGPPEPGATICVPNPRGTGYYHPSCPQAGGTLIPPATPPPTPPPPPPEPVIPPEPPPEPPLPPPPAPEPEPEPAPAPPSEEESLACPINGTFDLYDAETGEHIASDVDEADLPVGAEIVAIDDPRCGPVAAPPPTTLPSDAGPTQPGPAPGQKVPVPTQQLPPVPQTQQVPGQGSFTSQFIPCGQQPPVKVRSLRTETLPSRPDSWQDQWTTI